VPDGESAGGVSSELPPQPVSPAIAIALKPAHNINFENFCIFHPPQQLFLLNSIVLASSANRALS